MFSAAKPSAGAWLLPEQEMRSEGSTLRKVERRGGTGLCLVEQQGIFAKIRAVWPSNFAKKVSERFESRLRHTSAKYHVNKFILCQLSL